MVSVKLRYQPESITHLHLLSVLVTEIKIRELADATLIRILDAGCGNGHLDTFLYGNLISLFPGLQVEIYGYDVGDHGIHSKEFFIKTLNWCYENFPDVPWQDRFKVILQDQEWPYKNEFFDFVISNHVLEHVTDHDHFFSEHHRVLKDHGAGAHLFPLKHYIYEGHLLLPFVHRISDWNTLKYYIKFMSKIGFGKYLKKGSLKIDEFSERHADYITFYENYLSKDELFKIVQRARMRPSLKYTSDFYFHKIRSILHRKEIIELKRVKTYGFFYWLLNNFLKYISSITLFIEKANTYIK